MEKIGADKAAALIEAAGKILLIGHTDPDGDCLGSLYAMKAGLISSGKDVSVYLRKDLPLKYRFLSDELQKNTGLPQCDLTYQFYDVYSSLNLLQVYLSLNHL